MIFKSYQVEENLKILKNNLILFYGENLGLIKEFKDKIHHEYKKNIIIKLNQDEILNNKYLLVDEINNISLFGETKVILIDNVNDKIFDILKVIETNLNQNKVFLFSNILEKKSKLRNFFEKNAKSDLIPCYQDNQLSLRKIITKELKEYSGLTAEVINLILEYCNEDRIKLNNELQKIKVCFNKNIEIENLTKLLNLEEDDNFNNIKDSALIGDTKLTNKLLSTSIIDDDKVIYYLSLINQRLIKILDTFKMNISIDKAVNNLKPPVFWKDKPNFIKQATLWDKAKIRKALSITYNVELKLKSSSIDKKIIIKKLLVDICGLANLST